LATLYSVFTCIYKNKIGFLEMGLVISVLLLCNIHFTFRKRLQSDLNIHKKNKQIFIDYWIKLTNYFDNSDVKEILKYTSFFDEPMTIFYLILIMSYINYN